MQAWLAGGKRSRLCKLSALFVRRLMESSLTLVALLQIGHYTSDIICRIVVAYIMAARSVRSIAGGAASPSFRRPSVALSSSMVVKSPTAAGTSQSSRDYYSLARRTCCSHLGRTPTVQYSASALQQDRKMGDMPATNGHNEACCNIPPVVHYNYMPKGTYHDLGGYKTCTCTRTSMWVAPVTERRCAQM